MPADQASIMGIFKHEDQTAAAIKALRQRADWTVARVHSPLPSHAIETALAPPKSKVGWFTLAGGITGFFTGFLFAAFTATRWSLMVSGKPVVALVPFFIVGFEFTILFAVFGNVLGLISQARLPRFGPRPHYDDRFSGNRFGVLAQCRPTQTKQLIQFFQDRGAETTGAESQPREV